MLTITVTDAHFTWEERGLREVENLPGAHGEIVPDLELACPQCTHISWVSMTMSRASCRHWRLSLKLRHQ